MPGFILIIGNLVKNRTYLTLALVGSLQSPEGDKYYTNNTHTNKDIVTHCNKSSQEKEHSVSRIADDAFLKGIREASTEE